METTLIWLGLTATIATIALSKGRRPVVDAWPAYLFALPLAPRIDSLVTTLRSPISFALHDSALFMQQLAAIAFFGLMVGLFAARPPVSGQRATFTQGVVALLGTFILNLVGLVHVQSSVSTEALLVSSAVVVLGTVFAIWSLAVLGRCFGILPEVRGLVQRGPYRLVRHPVYLGEIVAALGLLLTTPHALTVALLALFIGFQYWRTVFEERALTATFPNDYPAFRALVPRLLPLLSPTGRRSITASRAIHGLAHTFHRPARSAA